MATQEVAIKPYVKVVLEEDSEVLDEVVIAVPYGTVKKANFSGSAAQVSGEKLAKTQVSNVSNALQGSVAGIETVSSSGTPGAGSTIHVRGIGSISASATPLIVVDGVPYSGSLNSISTYDIESMTVLKDAAANSMYGARGANGVIMITTKSGNGQKARINFDARYGFNTRGISPYNTIRNAGEYYEMLHESVTNNLAGTMGYGAASLYASENLIAEYARYNIYKNVADNNIIDPATGRLTADAAAASLLWTDNWLDNMDKGVHQDYNVSVTGGNDNTKVFFSLGYIMDDGIVPGSGFNRLNARTKIDQKINDRINAGMSIAYSRTDQKTFGDTDGNYSNIFMSSQMISPICPVFLYDANGNPVKDADGNQMYDYGTEHKRDYSAESNPYANAKDCINSDIRDNISGRTYFNWEIIDDLTFAANAAYDVFNLSTLEFMTPVAGDAKNVGGRGYKYATKASTMNINELLTWSPTFGKNNISIMLGHENNEYKYSNFYGHMTNFVDSKNPEFSNAINYQDMTSYSYAIAREAYFLKGDYNFDDRYYGTASIRRDASSIFAPASRWGTFWAIGGGWRFSKESFMAGQSWLNDGKLKASYGTQGNDEIGLINAYSDLYRIDRVDGSAALTKIQRGNTALSWEKSANLNAGIEGRIFDRFNFDINYFMKKTNGLLYASPLPPSQGDPNYIYRNEMDMKNLGFDFDLAADVVKTKDIIVRLTANGMHYKNKLTKLPDSKDPINFPDGYQSGNYWRSLGGSLYDWALIEYVGVDPQTGLPQYNDYYEVPVMDEEGNPVLDADGNAVTKEEVRIVNTTADMTTEDYRRHGKSAIPDFTGGFGAQVEAFGFDFSVQTAFSIGGYCYDSFYAGLMTSGEPGQGFHQDMLNRWTTPGQETMVPQLCYNGSTSIYSSSSTDRWLTSASWFALKNVTLGYTLPRTITKKVQIQNARVFFSGDNLWLKSARTGLDPRQSFSGTVGYVYSGLSNYSLGISLTL